MGPHHVRSVESGLDPPPDVAGGQADRVTGGECNEVFPNAAGVVSLVDRLVHHAEILKLAGKPHRLKEAYPATARWQDSAAGRSH